MKQQVLEIIDDEYRKWSVSASPHLVPLNKWKTHEVLKSIRIRIENL